MSDSKRHTGIVVGVDGSPASMIAVRWAAREAELRGVSLTLVHVVPATARPWLDSALVPEWMRAQRERGRELLEEARLIVGAAGGRSPVVDTEMPAARAVPALIEASADAQLVVVGSRGAGTLRGRYLGSVSWGLVHHAPCPVAILHDDISWNGESDDAPVLVGIDGSPESELAVAIAFDEASRRNVSLVALHAWKDVSVFDPVFSSPGLGWPALHALEAEALAERLAGWNERYPDVTVRRLIVRDDPVRQLVDQSASAQLVVVGSHGSGGFAGMLLGSTSAAVVLLTRAPVILARHQP